MSCHQSSFPINRNIYHNTDFVTAPEPAPISSIERSADVVMGYVRLPIAPLNRVIRPSLLSGPGLDGTEGAGRLSGTTASADEKDGAPVVPELVE
jgi:hypothetical protein